MANQKLNKKHPKLEIIYHPDEFVEGVRILMLTTRSKDGGRTNNPDRQKSNKKYVTRSKEEYYEKLDELLEEMTPAQRIYSTVDPRSIPKAIRIFKQRQLDADYYGEEEWKNFYVDIFNRWISSLQSPASRASQKFLFDIDDDGDNEDVGLNDVMFKLMELGIEDVYFYETKNGYHVITPPFNPSGFPASVQKNAMLLVAYYKDHVDLPAPMPVVKELQEYTGRR